MKYISTYGLGDNTLLSEILDYNQQGYIYLILNIPGFNKCKYKEDEVKEKERVEQNSKLIVYWRVVA